VVADAMLVVESMNLHRVVCPFSSVLSSGSRVCDMYVSGVPDCVANGFYVEYADRGGKFVNNRGEEFKGCSRFVRSRFHDFVMFNDGTDKCFFGGSCVYELPRKKCAVCSHWKEMIDYLAWLLTEVI
jgi:hypothetical protein